MAKDNEKAALSPKDIEDLEELRKRLELTPTEAKEIQIQVVGQPIDQISNSQRHGTPGDPVGTGSGCGVILGAIIGVILGGIFGGIGGAVGGLVLGGLLGAGVGAGIGWLIKQLDPQIRDDNETTWIVGGYLCVVVSLLFCPPLFGIAGVAIGIRNLGIPANVIHGRFQVGLSIACGLFGMCIGMALVGK